MNNRKTYRVYYDDSNQRLLEASSKVELIQYLSSPDQLEAYGTYHKIEEAPEYD